MSFLDGFSDYFYKMSKQKNPRNMLSPFLCFVFRKNRIYFFNSTNICISQLKKKKVIILLFDTIVKDLRTKKKKFF